MVVIQLQVGAAWHVWCTQVQVLCCPCASTMRCFCGFKLHLTLRPTLVGQALNTLQNRTLHLIITCKAQSPGGDHTTITWQIVLFPSADCSPLRSHVTSMLRRHPGSFESQSGTACRVWTTEARAHISELVDVTYRLTSHRPLALSHPSSARWRIVSCGLSSSNPTCSSQS